MQLEKANVLLFTRAMGLGGTENVVLQLCDFLYPRVSNLIVCSCGGVHVKRLEEIGITHYCIPDIIDKNPVSVLKVFTKLRKIISEEHINVIHTHHRMAAFYISVSGLYRTRFFVNTSHNTFHDKIKLTQLAYKHAHLIACGETVKQNLINKFQISSRRITVIHNAVKAFEGRIVIDKLLEELHADGCFIVGNVGRLSRQKGMEYFIRAIPLIIHKHPEARFVIAGTGEDDQKLKDLSIKEGIQEYLYFLGYRNDIQNLMCQLDLIVLSSLWEGLPLTPIEAYSVGKTVVATAVDGTVEIIRDGIDGCLISPQNSEEIAEKVNYLIENPDRKRNMEIQAVERYREEFSYEKLMDSYIKYYEEL